MTTLPPCTPGRRPIKAADPPSTPATATTKPPPSAKKSTCKGRLPADRTEAELQIVAKKLNQENPPKKFKHNGTWITLAAYKLDENAPFQVCLSRGKCWAVIPTGLNADKLLQDKVHSYLANEIKVNLDDDEKFCLVADYISEECGWHVADADNRIRRIIAGTSQSTPQSTPTAAYSSSVESSDDPYFSSVESSDDPLKTLAGLVGTVTTKLADKIAESATTLADKIAESASRMEALDKNNKEQLRAVWDRIATVNDTIASHDALIRKLEKDSETNGIKANIHTEQIEQLQKEIDKMKTLRCQMLADAGVKEDEELEEWHDTRSMESSDPYCSTEYWTDADAQN